MLASASPPGTSRLRAHGRAQFDALVFLHPSCVPYAELMRLHKPVGIMNIFFPYLFGSLFAGCASNQHVQPGWLLIRMVALFGTAFILRSAGCTWNDIVDRDIDRLVERTRLRPMARGAISLTAAYIFAAAQSGLWLIMLAKLLPGRWKIHGLPLLCLVWFYPFTKRFTNYAQLVRGITLGCGGMLGSAAVGLDIFDMDAQGKRGQILGLYLTYGLWTIIHDTVYACQDIQDDRKAGIKSMAVLWSHRTKILLLILAFLQVALLWVVGIWMEVGLWYYCVAVGGNFLVLQSMILLVNLSDPKDCLWWFQIGSLLIGASVTVGLGGEYVSRLR